MATDQEKLAALRDAYDSGVVKGNYGDYSFEYRTLDELERVMRTIEGRINGARNPANSRRLASFSKGLE